MDISNIKIKSSEIRENAAKYADAIRYLAMLVCGTAMGLIFNVMCGYEYSTSLSEYIRYCFLPPFENVHGFFEVLKIILKASRTDALLLLLVFMFGVTYICHQGCNAILILRGFALGISTGALATAAAAQAINVKHPLLSSAIFLLTYCAISILSVLAACLASRAAVVFRGLSERVPNLIFTARFGIYLLSFAAAEGLAVILKTVYLVFIHIFNI